MLERTNEERVRRWNANRSTSIVLLGISMIACMAVIKMIIDFTNQTATNKRLEVMKEEIVKQNEYLEQESTLLHDSEYYSIYIREEFQFNGDNVILIPEK